MIASKTEFMRTVCFSLKTQPPSSVLGPSLGGRPRGAGEEPPTPGWELLPARDQVWRPEQVTR